ELGKSTRADGRNACKKTWRGNRGGKAGDCRGSGRTGRTRQGQHRRVVVRSRELRGAMDQKTRNRDLFIVDNSVSGWTALHYLEEWTEIANKVDIATGHFEVGALLALDGKWQRLNKIRILMGAETNHRTRKAILEAASKRAIEMLDKGIEADKETN